MSKPYSKQLLEINIAMVLISTSGALGRYITLSPMTSIWARSSLAALILIAFCLVSKYSFKISSSKDIKKIVLASIFLGIHWVFYFYSLQLTNVAVGMLTLFTYPIFTVIFEPLFFKTKWTASHIVSSMVAFLGLYILLPSLDLESDFTYGILLGLISSLSYTIRNLILKTQVGQYNGSVIMSYQLVLVAIGLIPFLGSVSFAEIQTYGLQLGLLALVTTAIGHTLFLMSFKHFSISVASILSGLQPVYGIIIAYFFLNEMPDANSFLGGSLIIGTVVYTGWKSRA